MKLRLRLAVASLLLASAAPNFADAANEVNGRNPNKLAANKLAANKLAANKLAANKLAANKLAANKLAANKLAANKLAANKLAANSTMAEAIAENHGDSFGLRIDGVRAERGKLIAK